MYFSWQFPNKDNFKDILLKYYLFYEQYLGKNILSSITKKNINKGIFNNTILFMDENYKLACETIYSIFMDKNIKFLVIYDLNNNVIACSRVKLSIENYPNNAIVGTVKEAHKINPDLCVKCGACMEKCKFGAIYKE